MMWRFTIIDRNGDPTEIEEPVGFDAGVVEIKRDPTWHGIFFSNLGETYEFHGKAMQMLKAEYEQYGPEGEMTLLIEEGCVKKTEYRDNPILTEDGNIIGTENGPYLITGQGYFEEYFFEEFTRMRFNFSRYEFYCGDSCYVKIPVEVSGQTMELRNRVNQKVDLDSLKAFDGTTDLLPYDKLGFNINLPSKGILLQNIFENKKENATPIAGVGPNTSSGSLASSEQGMIEFGFDTQVATEIGNSGTELQPKYNCVLSNNCNSINKFDFAGPGVCIAPLDITAITNYQEGTPNYGMISDTVDFDIQITGLLKIDHADSILLRFLLLTLPGDKDGTSFSDYIVHQNYTLIGGGATGMWPVPVSNGDSWPLSYGYHDPAFRIAKGDRVYAFLYMYHYVLNSNNTGSAFSISFDAGSYIKMKTLSHTEPTGAKVYMVNEALSRISESITNDKLRAYSDYFGRTDSQPYSHNVDGCGSLEVITDGIRIRRAENKIPDKPSLYSVSLQDMFEGLAPIHNIGMGIEPDPGRPGYNRLRVENWRYFYDTDVVMSCTNVDDITLRISDREIYSTFQFGYAKWEAEEYNGLDEFLTKRNYRTTLSQVKNDLVKLSKFMASGYALEITRRKGNEDSKDWRFDKETFIICIKRQSSVISCNTNFRDRYSITFKNIVIPSCGINGLNLVVGDTVTITGSTSNNGSFTVKMILFDNSGNPIGFRTIEPIVTTLNDPCTITNVTAGNIAAELGNILTPSNIIDPNTIYNYRISPVRNAMRWMDWVLRSYRRFEDDSKIIFTDGDGNYYASGKMADSNCRMEANVIEENATINRLVFADQDRAKPLMMSERIEFDYPLSSKEYKQIAANPRGLIHYQCDCQDGFGWIDTVKYKPDDGMASFILIPKID